MKIKKFDESLKSKRWKPTDKIIKGNIYFEVDAKTIEKTDSYIKEIEDSEDIGSARIHGIQEWIYNGGDTYMSFELVDGLDNPIKDEEEFDKQVEKIKKYNI
jgi:hypothetical protein